MIVVALALGLVPLVTFAITHGGVLWPDQYALQVLWFTLMQATLSTLLSVGPAVFVARAFARQQFRGRSLVLALMAVPLSLPTIVAIFGLTAIYGQAGVAGGWFNLYGLPGILLAHVFFNLPLASRLLLESLEAIPPENHRLAAQLNFNDVAIFKHVDWPALQPVLPRVVALVFLLCAASFVIVLVLGGPGATTLEVAIYQSLRMDFDVSRALTLSLLQVCLSMILVWVAAKALVVVPVTQSLRLSTLRSDGGNITEKLTDRAVIAAAMLLVFPIFLAILWQGIGHIRLNGVMLQAIATSLAIALISCVLALPLCFGLAQAQMRLNPWRGPLLALGLCGFIVPPAVLATGWFLALRNFDNHVLLALLLIAAMNALMALPFLLAVIAPALEKAAQQHDKLCTQLGIRGLNRLKLIDLPTLRGPMAQASLMVLVLSMGDLTAVTLLGNQGLVTLPGLVQQQMGHYQSSDAGGTALVLALLCLTLTGLTRRVTQWL
jgi:thiamine transport system permease protein